jgi:hypothetical protein
MMAGAGSTRNSLSIGVDRTVERGWRRRAPHQGRLAQDGTIYVSLLGAIAVPVPLQAGFNESYTHNE